MKAFSDPHVKAVFNAYPPDLRARLLALRELIFDTASRTEGVGPLEETLKWGQPSYLTASTGSGTTIRISSVKKSGDEYGLFVHCQTTLIETFRRQYGENLTFDGNRCIRFHIDEDLCDAITGHCIAMALTYHLRKKAA